MEANGVEWPDDQDRYPVRIHVYDGVTDILRKRAIRSRLAEKGVETLGIVIDANDEFGGRWQRLRDECGEAFPDLPETLFKGLDQVGQFKDCQPFDKRNELVHFLRHSDFSFVRHA